MSVYVWCICVCLCVYVHMVMMCLMVTTLLHLASQSKRAGWMPAGASQHGIQLGEITKVLRIGSQYFSFKNGFLGVPELSGFSDADSVSQTYKSLMYKSRMSTDYSTWELQPSLDKLSPDQSILSLQSCLSRSLLGVMESESGCLIILFQNIRASYLISGSFQFLNER